MSTKYIMMILYDIPSTTKEERHAYTLFRNNVLKEGFYQLQESVYVKGIRNKSVVERINRDLLKVAPKNSNIRSFIFLQTNFDKMININGEVKLCEKILQNDIKIIEF